MYCKQSILFKQNDQAINKQTNKKNDYTERASRINPDLPFLQPFLHAFVLASFAAAHKRHQRCHNQRFLPARQLFTDITPTHTFVV